MTPLTPTQIRSSFVNATRGEANRAVLPDLERVTWDRLDLLGWRDPKAPLAAYVVLELDGDVTGIVLRSTERGSGPRPRAMCAWCEDVVETDDVTLYVARRAGPAGRKGDTVGTLLCTDLACSAHVRRRPTAAEAGSNVAEVREQIVADRIAGLQERSQRFVRGVLQTR